MATAALREADVRVRDAVMRQLEWDPEVDASEIGVVARDGTVTLTGFIDSYSGKLGAERAAKRVRGVRAVANDVEVRLKLDRPDPDIAADVAQGLALCSIVPVGVQAVVHHGHVTLTGSVGWMYQKQSAEDAVRHVRAVRSVMNHIAVAPGSAVRDLRHRIVRALHQNADVDARHIAVTVAGGTATLTGTVGTWLQREAAERAAATAPGIADVDNRILVESADDGTPGDWDETC